MTLSDIGPRAPANNSRTAKPFSSAGARYFWPAESAIENNLDKNCARVDYARSQFKDLAAHKPYFTPVGGVRDRGGPVLRIGLRRLPGGTVRKAVAIQRFRPHFRRKAGNDGRRIASIAHADRVDEML